MAMPTTTKNTPTTPTNMRAAVMNAREVCIASLVRRWFPKSAPMPSRWPATDAAVTRRLNTSSARPSNARTQPATTRAGEAPATTSKSASPRPGHDYHRSCSMARTLGLSYPCGR
jgi:hypothetical protein